MYLYRTNPNERTIGITLGHADKGYASHLVLTFGVLNAIWYEVIKRRRAKESSRPKNKASVR